MIATIVIAITTFILVALSILFFPHFKIKNIQIDTYWIVALVGALALIFAQLVPFQTIVEQLTASSSINPLKILILFFSMTILSIFLDEVGLFRYLAKKAVKFAKKSQISLFLILYLLTSILTIFTSNDIVILTLTPFICFFCKNTKINPIPFLVAEFAAANTWSMMLIIGNPTNIYLATYQNISFLDYFKVMFLPTLAAGIVEIAIIILIFFKQLKKPLTVMEDDYHIESKVDLIVGLAHLGVCLIFLVISSYISWEMWLISLICASSLILCVLIIRLVTKKNWSYLGSSFKRLPYQLIPFVLSMFVIVIALNYQGVSQEIAKFLGNQNTIWTYGLSSYVVDNLINNIPMSILFSTFPSGLEGDTLSGAIYATIIGSNIGAFLTSIGALAGIMFSSLLREHHVNYGFKEFVKYGSLVSVPTIAVALLVLQFVI